MTIGELYHLAGPVTATLMLVFTPVGMVVTVIWIICKYIYPIEDEP